MSTSSSPILPLSKQSANQATLGGGCFWCLEAAYQQVAGITQVVSGFAGGQRPNPSYEQVVTGVTGHAEVVQLTFDPGILSYSDILDIFWIIHNPTTPNRQGYDVGSQYRSIILYHDEAQKAAAWQSVERVAQLWDAPIVTQVVPLETFYPAEAYHQNYFRSNPSQAYCQAVINPKLAKLREHFADRLTNGGA